MTRAVRPREPTTKAGRPRRGRGHHPNRGTTLHQDQDAAIRRGTGAGSDDRRFDVLVSDTATPCGVEAFARRLSETLGPASATRVLGRGAAAGVAGDGAVLVLNLPVVAWKRMLAAPVVAALGARRAGRSVVVILHEWADLDPKRRASYVPLLMLADTVLFSCPLVARGFSGGAVSALTTPARGVLPIPPNVSLPAVLWEGPHAERVRRERGRGRTVIGHFGSIYPRKRSTFVLDVAAEMKSRGEAPFVVFAGSFIRGQDDVEREFFEQVRRLGLQDDVLVTGFIAGEDELFGLLTLVDAFVYSFAEGLSTRRASVFACLTSGKPVVVNAPREATDFDHHPVYREQLASGLLRLVPTEAGAGAFADAVLSARGAAQRAQPELAASAWAALVEAFSATLGGAARRRVASPARGMRGVEGSIAGGSRP